MVGGMRRVLVSLLVVVLGLTSACSVSVRGTAVSGGPLDIDSPFSTTPSDDPTSPSSPSASRSSTPPTSTSGTSTVSLCSLIGWTDMPYNVADKKAPPTDQDYDTTYDQSCKWQTTEGSLDVGVTMRFREGKPVSLQQSTGEYDVGGRKITYFDRTTDPEVQPSCVLVMDYAGGGLGIIVIDGSTKFGPICDQGKHVAEALLVKEPS
jgi:hypothetical protein